MIIFQLSDYFYKKVNGKVLLLFLILYAIIGFGIIPYKMAQMQQQYGSDLRPFDLTFGYDKAFADDFLSRLGDSGRAAYVSFVSYYDTIYPFVYGGLLIFILSFLIKGSKYQFISWIRLLNLLPILIVLVDFLENSCSIYNTLHYPDYSLRILAIGSIFTQLKWVLVGTTFAFILFFGAKKLIKQIK